MPMSPREFYNTGTLFQLCLSVSTSARDMSPNLGTNATARQAMWLQAWTMLLSDFIQHEMCLDFVLKPQCQGYHTNQANYQLLSRETRGEPELPARVLFF